MDMVRQVANTEGFGHSPRGAKQARRTLGLAATVRHAGDSGERARNAAAVVTLEPERQRLVVEPCGPYLVTSLAGRGGRCPQRLSDTPQVADLPPARDRFLSQGRGQRRV